jgi:hypothetical protein
MRMGCKLKHSFKQVRECFKSSTETYIGNVSFEGGFLRELLLSTGSKPVAVQKMFATGFANAMDIPSMVEFFWHLGKVHQKPEDHFGKATKSIVNYYNELQLLFHYSHLLFTTDADKCPYLSEKFENIAELMHIVFFCYHCWGSKFLASITYLNQHRLFRSIY